MATNAKQIIIRGLVAVLLAVAFVLETSPAVNAQGRKLAGMGAMNHTGRQLEYGQTDDYLKLDKDGKVIIKPGQEPKEPKSVTVYEDDNEDITDADPVKDGEVTIVCTVAVPHMKKNLTQVTAYPYPMKPPVVKQKIKLLPDKDKALKQMMLSTGYFSRASLDVPYPPGGWRWQYAFQKAIKNSGISMPHSIFEHYIWADRMLPFMRAQTKIYNQFERQRVQMYNDALAEFNTNRTEIEDSATHRGMAPITMKRVHSKSPVIGMHYAANLKSGKWWMLATHRVPGLKYYWLVPAEVGEKGERVVLNESNAIYIEGGW